ncbi:hypothetical protein LCGC14_1351350, partial [marine sediment metagenome]
SAARRGVASNWRHARGEGDIRMATASQQFQIITKPGGAICNLDCTYCYYLSKEALYPGSRFRMADDLLETYIKQLLESQRAPTVTVGWQGQEPVQTGLSLGQPASRSASAQPPIPAKKWCCS